MKVHGWNRWFTQFCHNYRFYINPTIFHQSLIKFFDLFLLLFQLWSGMPSHQRRQVIPHTEDDRWYALTPKMIPTARSRTAMTTRTGTHLKKRYDTGLQRVLQYRAVCLRDGLIPCCGGKLGGGQSNKEQVSQEWYCRGYITGKFIVLHNTSQDHSPF